VKFLYPTVFSAPTGGTLSEFFEDLWCR